MDVEKVCALENVWRFLGSKEAAELLRSVPNEPICAKAEVNFKTRTSVQSMSSVDPFSTIIVGGHTNQKRPKCTCLISIAYASSNFCKLGEFISLGMKANKIVVPAFKKLDITVRCEFCLVLIIYQYPLKYQAAEI